MIRGLIVQACELGGRTAMDETARAAELRSLKQSAQETLERARESAVQDAAQGERRAFDEGFRAGIEVCQRTPEQA